MMSSYTSWKGSKYGVFSDPYFPVVNLRTISDTFHAVVAWVIDLADNVVDVKLLRHLIFLRSLALYRLFFSKLLILFVTLVVFVKLGPVTVTEYFWLFLTGNFSKQLIQGTWGWRIVSAERLTDEKRLTRSIHRKCYAKEGVLKNFAKFTGKTTCAWASFLIKLQALAKLQALDVFLWILRNF